MSGWTKRIGGVIPQGTRLLSQESGSLRASAIWVYIIRLKLIPNYVAVIGVRHEESHFNYCEIFG